MMTQKEREYLEWLVMRATYLLQREKRTLPMIDKIEKEKKAYDPFHLANHDNANQHCGHSCRVSCADDCERDCEWTVIQY